MFPPVKTIQGGKSEDVFFYRVCGIDSSAINQVESIAVDYSALVPVLSRHVMPSAVVIVATARAAAGIVSGANIRP